MNPQTHSTRRPLRLVLASALAVALVLAFGALHPGHSATADASTPDPRDAYSPKVGHVFVINIENKGYDKTWGADSAAPYLSKELRAKGVLLNAYYGTAHNSQGNYIAQVSGQGPNLEMQADCQIFSNFTSFGTGPLEQEKGSGCVFPAKVPTLMKQIDSSGRSWKGYMEDMGTACRHPKVGTIDPTQKAKVGDQYAARHNPFVYFHSVIDDQSYCDSHVVDLGQLDKDLASAATTPNLSYITPNLCNDGHDAPCVDGRPGGLASTDEWMKVNVPKILASPAFQQDGMLVITADESDSPMSDASACCKEGASQNALLPGITGPGGGKIGTLVISKWSKPGSWSTTPYNHYSLLASIEDAWRLPYIGYAATPGLPRFGLDVFNTGWSGR